MYRLAGSIVESTKTLSGKGLEWVKPGTSHCTKCCTYVVPRTFKILKRTVYNSFRAFIVVPLRIERRPAASEATILSVVLRDQIYWLAKV